MITGFAKHNFPLACMLILACSGLLAQEHHVLIITAVPSDNQSACEHLQETQNQLNQLHDNYPSIHPWFNLVACNDNQHRLVFGWLPPITGLIQDDFPQMSAGLYQHLDGLSTAPVWVSKATYQSWEPVSVAPPPKRLPSHYPLMLAHCAATTNRQVLHLRKFAPCERQ